MSSLLDAPSRPAELDPIEQEFSFATADFERVRKLIYQRAGISLHDGKRAMVYSRLSRRLRETGDRSFADYLNGLERASGAAGEAEWQEFINCLTTNLTSFFREEHHFHALAEALRSTGGRPLRLWCNAASTGEEPYSIAMTLAECLPHTPWRVEATDISRRILAKASAAIYAEDTVSRLSPALVRTHFQRGFGPQEGMHRIKPALRDRVAFRHLNLLEGAPPFTDLFHVIFCRNVMIYFDHRTQEELVGRLVRLLHPGGYLFVGHSESLTHLPHSLERIRPAVYRKPIGS
jgi:chemotaxis protein methyltransferase CheR